MCVTDVEGGSAIRILNCEPSKQTERDWRLGDALAADPTMAATAAALPKAFDRREPRWWSVVNQYDTGSCVGWACVDSVVRYHLVKAGRLSENERLSAWFIWMAAKETEPLANGPAAFHDDSGTSLKAALDVCRKLGAVRDAVLPFAADRMFPWPPPRGLYALAARLKIESYFNLELASAAWKYWLVHEGPILARLSVDATFMVAPHGHLDQYLPDTELGGHAVAIVGYDRDGFIVRNTWGDGWGDHGYAYASNDYAAAAFTEAYGVRVA